MKIYKSKTDSYSIAHFDDNTFLLKNNDSFYKLNRKNFEECINIKDLTFVREIKDNIFIMLFMFITIFVTIIMYFFFVDFTIVDSNFLYANIVLVVNIFFHESGHILFLKIFNKNNKFKLGFKFIFIFPAFYVDTSESYFLPLCKRASVYLAGNFMNCLYLLICIFFLPSMNKYNYLVMSAVLVNFLPIIKSDGYYTFMALFNKHCYAKSKVKSIFDDMIRGLVMFLLLFCFSKIKIIF